MPALTAHDRFDILLNERERVMTDLAVAVDLLFAVTLAGDPDAHELAMRRARAFLLLPEPQAAA